MGRVVKLKEVEGIEPVQALNKARLASLEVCWWSLVAARLPSLPSLEPALSRYKADVRCPAVLLMYAAMAVRCLWCAVCVLSF